MDLLLASYLQSYKEFPNATPNQLNTSTNANPVEIDSRSPTRQPIRPRFDPSKRQLDSGKEHDQSSLRQELDGMEDSETEGCCEYL